jgi:3-isopropylmalate dehydrogenase
MQATVAVLAGDGIGPEVAAEGVRILQAVGEQWGHEWQLRPGAIGGNAIDATGTALPQETIDTCLASDAVLLGAVGGPKWDDPRAKVRPEQGLLGIRKALGVWANLRPVTILPGLVDASPLRPELLEGVDMLVIRELTGGLYFGDKRREQIGPGQERVIDTCVYTTGEVERVVRRACEAARLRRGKVTSVDKANVLETSRLWREVATRIVREEFPDLTLEHMLVDAAAMHLLRRPADFDVIVTENMFGDILSDETSMLTGSLGMLPSASLGDGTLGLYEPIHGSAPDIAGRGIANPLGTIASVAMLLRYSLGLEDEARAVEAAVAAVVRDGIVTADLVRPGGRAYSTTDVGAAVAAALGRA